LDYIHFLTDLIGFLFKLVMFMFYRLCQLDNNFVVFIVIIGLVDMFCYLFKMCRHQ